MATFFTRGVETASELRISLRRLDAFLALPEPPPPSHLSATGGAAQVRGHHGRQPTASSPRRNCPLAHQMSAHDRTWWMRFACHKDVQSCSPLSTLTTCLPELPYLRR